MRQKLDRTVVINKMINKKYIKPKKYKVIIMHLVLFSTGLFLHVAAMYQHRSIMYLVDMVGMTNKST